MNEMFLSPDEQRRYLVNIGTNKPGVERLKYINTLAPFVEAMQTEIGAQLLKEDIERHSMLVNKIYNDIIENGNVEQRDAIELRLIQDRLKLISTRLKSFNVGVKMIKKIAQE